MDKLELPASLTRRPAPARKRKKDAVAASTRKSVGVLVLGMHRSGTSALTRVLNLLGAALPKNLLGANYSNPEGHWESLRGIEINDGLLTALGRTWDDVRELPAGWMQRPETALAREQIRALLDLEFSKEKLWVLKDPRLCRLAPIWLEAMDDAGIEARIVVPVRQPAEVAYSLARRDGMATGQSYFLWLQHLIDAERSTRSRPRSLVHFHQLMSDWRGVTDRIARQLGISWPNKSRQTVLAVDEFLRPEDVHADAKADDELATRLALPSPLAKLYAELMEAEPAQAWEAIAGVANSLSRSAPVFVPAIDALTRRLQRVQARADDVNAALAAGMADVPRWTRTAEQLEQLQEARPLLHELIAQVEAQRGEYGPRLHEQVQYLAMLQADYQQLLAKVDATPALLHELVAQVEAQRGELGPRQAEIVQGLSQLQLQSIGLVERIDAAATRAGDATPLLNELVAQVEAQRGELAPRQAELVQGLSQLQLQSIGLVERIDAVAARAGEATPLLNEMVAQIEAQRRELGPRLVEQLEAIAAVQRQFAPLFERLDVAPPLLHELIAQVEAQRNESGPRLAAQQDALGNVQAQLVALLEKAQASPPLLHELIAQVEAQRAEYGPRLAEQVHALGQLQHQLHQLIGTAEAPPLQAQLQALAEKADASPPLLHELIAQIEAQRREFGPPIQDAPQQLAVLRAENRQGFEALAQSTPLLHELIAQVEAQRGEYGPRLHEQIQALSQLQLQLQQLVGTADAAPLQVQFGELKSDYVRLLERAEQAPPLLHELIAQLEAQRNELNPRLDAQAGQIAELRAENRQGFDALAQSTPLLNELIAQVEAQRHEYGPRLTEQQAWLAQLHAGNERNFEKLDRAEPLIAELIRQIEAQREEFAPALQRQLQQIETLHQAIGERDQQLVRLHRIVGERQAELAASGHALAGRQAHASNLEQQLEALRQHAAAREVVLEDWHQHAEGLQKVVDDRDATLAELRQRAEEQQQVLAAREVVLEEWHQHADNLQKVLDDREATLAELRQRAEDQQQVLAELRQRAEDQQQVLAAREVVLEEWHQHADNLQKVVDDREATLAGLREHAEGLERQATEREVVLAEWSRHAEGLQQVLGERDAALADLGQHAEGLQQVLGERDAALADLGQHAEDLQQVLAERDAALAELHQHAENLQQLVTERDALIAEWTKHAGNLEEALAERDTAIAGQQQQLNDRHAAIAGLHQALEALEQQMVERDAHLAEWSKHADNLQQEIAGRDHGIADLASRLEEKEHARANLEQVLASREGYIEALRQTVTDGSTHIGQLTEMVADRDGNVADLSQRLAQRDAHVAQLTDVVAHREANLSDLSRRLAQRDAHIAQLVQVVRDNEAVVHELLSSSSWRLTRPLRAMKNLLSGKSPSTEVRDPSAFDAEEIASWNAGIADGGLPSYTHDLRIEERAALPAPVAPQAPAAPTESADFDRDFYASQYPDIIEAGLDPYAHFVSHGRAEGRLGKLPVFDFEPGGKGFDPNRETVLVVSHEASRTGAPVLSLNIVETLQRRYNVVSLLMGPGLMVEAFRQESALLVGPLKLHGDTPKAKLLIGQLHRAYPLKYAIANSIESRVVLEALTKLGVPSVALVHEFAAYTRPRHAFHEAIFWASETVFSTPITHDNAVSEIPELREQPANILPQGRSLLVTEERSEAAKAKEDARVMNTLRPDGPLDDRVVIIGAGFVQQRKGVDLFIEVAARVLATEAGKRCRFVWIGKGYDPENDMGYSVYLADQLRRSGIERQVVMMDETSSIEVAYDNADILLISSRLDPLPNVAIDAMSHGMPVICFERTTGFADILAESGLRGQCVAPYLDTADMAAKVVALASSREQREQLGERMQQIVAERFDMGRYVDSLDALAAHAGQRIAADEVLAREIVATGLMRRDFFPRAFEREAPAEDLVRFLYLRGWESGIGRRKLFPGFHPGIWQERHGLIEAGQDPLVDWLRAGRPPGPWTYEVIADTDPAAPSPPDDARIALHLHVYYADLLPEMLTRLDQNAVRPDLFISVPNARVGDDIREALAGYTGRVIDVQVVPNRGRDIGPFLTAFGPALLDNYDLVGHLHTKKTADLADASVGKLWYAFLLENLLGGKAAMADRILGRMAADPSIGMVFPDDPNIVGWGTNQPFIADIAERVGVREFPVHFHFPVGTMFWARVEALRPLLELGLPWESYPTEPLPYDGSVLHALERLFPLVAEQRGTRIALTNVSGVSR